VSAARREASRREVYMNVSSVGQMSRLCGPL
jgi:hypothetical protein